MRYTPLHLIPPHTPSHLTSQPLSHPSLQLPPHLIAHLTRHLTHLRVHDARVAWGEDSERCERCSGSCRGGVTSRICARTRTSLVRVAICSFWYTRIQHIRWHLRWRWRWRWRWWWQWQEPSEEVDIGAELAWVHVKVVARGELDCSAVQCICICTLHHMSLKSMRNRCGGGRGGCGGRGGSSSSRNSWNVVPCCVRQSSSTRA